MRSLVAAAGFILLVPAAAPQDVALKDLMPKGLVVGVAINQRQFDGTDTAAVEIITKQFNQISPENALKFQPTQPAADRYTFEAADRYVQFGLERHMQVVGHNLVWHSQTGAWVFEGADGKPADRDALLARMRDHIRTVVGRYKVRFTAGTSSTKPSRRTARCASRRGRSASATTTWPRRSRSRTRPTPIAELYYNDFNLEKPAKRAGVIKLVKDLQARKVRIDGIGNQGHWRLDTPTIGEIEMALVELHATGLKVMYTELDINLLPNTRARRRSRGRQSVRDRAAGRRAAAARAPLRRRVPCLPEAFGCRDAGYVLGIE